MKPLLMQGLPNSGSTWFAALLAKNIRGCRYYDKEFFNPVCNIKHEVVLRKNFGCELVSCYRNIATAGGPGIHDDIRATWGAENYTFTKECNSAFKLPVFIEHFDCFVFLRSAKNTFPPGRARVWSFYEHAWWALREAGHDVVDISTPDRAHEAFGILTEVILYDANRLKVPVIWWEDLAADPGGVLRKLLTVTGLDAAGLLKDMTATFKDKAEPALTSPAMPRQSSPCPSTPTT